ncbi:PRPF38A [Cordylochernes scorpioides]|uniref:Pre-mRNA-splicing factor 38 n=1 Tax=Cordylochernes scorpioides TaxID=51811 RepID=A0ABY6KEK1_9ARAC|nr:PRPF38A [Cordylochernes scorpioides]
MANRTVKDAISVRGTNPQYLVEKIIRTRIYDSQYWKEECFALSAELVAEKAIKLRFIGGVFGGNIKPTPFLCLTLKMLQIQPSKDIIIEFIRQEDFNRYVRALGALYLRLTGSALDCYKYLEPLYNDYKKLRMQNKMGKYELLHMDEFIDMLFREERVCDIILPRVQARHVLEETNQLEPLKSALEDDLEMEESEEEMELPLYPRRHRCATGRRSPTTVTDIAPRAVPSDPDPGPLTAMTSHASAGITPVLPMSLRAIINYSHPELYCTQGFLNHPSEVKA